MCKPRRVRNVTTGYWLKPAQAQRAIEECAAAWVEEGVSMRSVTLAEAIALRNAQAARREPVAMAELPGVRYEPTMKGLEGFRLECKLMRDANRFAASMAQAAA